MKPQLSSSTRIPKNLGGVLGSVTCLAMAVAIYMVFFYAPTETTMGDVQRIFYFHVSSAWISFLAFFVVMLTSIVYLITHRRRWDIWALASAEIGTLFCTMVMMTGPLWAKPVWNVWWTWDIRLTTTLILWLMYIGYLMLRHYVSDERGAKYAAVFGIIAFIDVPFVYFSIRWWRTLHPEAVIAGKSSSGLEPQMLLTLLVSVLSFMILYAYLLYHRIAIERMQDDLEEIRQALSDQEASQEYLIENKNFIIEEYTFKEMEQS